MFTVSAVELHIYLKSKKPSALLELREEGSGERELVREVTHYEAQILLAENMVSGQSNRRGMQYLLLIVPAGTALAMLRRKLCQGGRTVAEDCQLVVRNHVPGGGVFYTHVRNGAYNPIFRPQLHPPGPRVC